MPSKTSMNDRNDTFSPMHVIYVFFLILCSTYHMLPTFGYGHLLSSPVFYIAPFILMYEAHLFISKKQKLDYIDKRVLFLFIYIVCVSFVSITFYYFKYGNVPHLTHSAIYKTATYSLNWIICITLFMHLKHLFLNISPKTIHTSFLLVVIFYVFVLIIEKLTIPYAFYWLHAPTTYYYPYCMIRLLTPESSASAPVIIMLCTILHFYSSTIKKNKLGTILSILLLVLYTIFTESKGYFACAFLAILLSSLSTWHKIRSNRKITNIRKSYFFIYFMLALLVCALILVAAYTSHVYSTSTISNICFPKIGYKTSTYTTRLAGILTGWISLLHYPFGVGFGMYQWITRQILLSETVAQIVIKILPPQLINFHEINAYTTNYINIGTKNALSNLIVFSGIVGIVTCTSIFIFLYTRIKKQSVILLTALIFTVLSISSYLSFTRQYPYAILLAFLCVSKLNNKDST